jgi:pyridinium-3,5-biscarboxylic acid mononucleotide synthase
MKHIEDILENYKDGRLDIEEVLKEIKCLPYKDLGFARVDHHRTLRQGLPETVFCPGKEKEEIVDIIRELKSKNHTAIATRAEQSVADYVLENLPGSVYHKKARIISYGEFPEPVKNNYALVISAGTADLPVAEESIITLKAAGIKTETLFDCGVAGSHRILGEFETILGASAIIVIAGMEGALASFVGGMSGCPVIAVPTSVGYGASFGGVAALLGMINSCASNVSVVNIDNGFSAACIAAMIVKQAK